MNKIEKRKKRNEELRRKRKNNRAYQEIGWSEAVKLVIELVGKIDFYIGV